MPVRIWCFSKFFINICFICNYITCWFFGTEVVYIKDEFASLARPVRELKGFQRIHLKAGESKQVQFEITPGILTMLDKNLNPVIEPGTFRIMIGASSKDIRLRDIMTIIESN